MLGGILRRRLETGLLRPKPVEAIDECFDRCLTVFFRSP